MQSWHRALIQLEILIYLSISLLVTNNNPNVLKFLYLMHTMAGVISLIPIHLWMLYLGNSAASTIYYDPDSADDIDEDDPDEDLDIWLYPAHRTRRSRPILWRGQNYDRQDNLLFDQKSIHIGQVFFKSIIVFSREEWISCSLETFTTNITQLLRPRICGKNSILG